MPSVDDSITALSLSTRARTCLARRSIGTIGHLVDLSVADLWSNTKGIGKTIIVEIIDKLALHGFKLKGELVDPQAALDQAEQALNDNDHDTALELLGNYENWRANGGFQPSGGDLRHHQLKVRALKMADLQLL